MAQKRTRHIKPNSTGRGAQINIGLKITKKDIITIILLSIVFFGIALWNVGLVNFPVTNWQSTTNESFYVNLGSSQQVQNVYFWVRSGNATTSVYSGSPGNWTYQGQFSNGLQPRGTDYSVYQSLGLGVNTQFLEFNITAINYDSQPMFSNWGVTNPSDQPLSPFIQVTEIGIESQTNQQIPIVGITGLNSTDATLLNLVDEQSKLQIPPTYMSKMYFDEVYFARSAENYVNHMIPNERTHPPLGKLIEATGVAVFGETPFGWRIMGVLFATLMIPFMYLLGKKLFGTWIGGFSAAFLLTFDFMHFTMARIGTADTYVVFFSLLSQLFFFIYFMNVVKSGWKTSVLPLFFAVLFFALGFSTKWFTIFGALGMLALLLIVRFRDVFKLKSSLADKYLALFNYPALLFLGFVCVAVLVYFATYIPEMLAGDSFPTIIKLQLAMFNFHSGNVVDTSSAPWWSWPFMFRLDGANVPRWFDISYLPNNVVSTISVFGNPVVWWIGFVLILVLAERAIHGRQLMEKLYSRISKSSLHKQISIRAQGWDLPAIYIVVVFFFTWLPYVFIGRATYVYHFYLSVPLLCLATTYFINKYWNTRKGKIAAITIFAGVVAMFVLFYPVISGAPATTESIKNLKWFHSWGFLG
jgi:dolichyl-phosphate-mannose-protein mannosyltransferase